MKSGRSEHGYANFMQWKYWWKKDGINNMAAIRYKVLSTTKEPLYTNITVDVGPPPDPPRRDVPEESYFWFLWFFYP